MIDEAAYHVMKEFLYNFGFPIFVVLWFMFRTERILKENTQALNKISETLATLNRRKP
jgi:hypothetical protein